MGDSSVLRVDKTVDIENALKGALEILKLVRESWKTSDVHYKVCNSCIFLNFLVDVIESDLWLFQCTEIPK